MNKNAIKKFAIEARKKLIDSVTDKAGMLGITEKSCSEPITKGLDFEVYQTVAGTEVTLNKRQCEQRRRLVLQIESRGFETVVEEVAYTWFNRICAIRFMEVNDYMWPERVRILSSEKKGKLEPDVITKAPNIELGFTDDEKEEIINLKLSEKPEDANELFRKIFLKQCHWLNSILPGLFEDDSDYMELLFEISYNDKDGVIYMLVNPETGIPESDFNVSTLDEKGNPTGQVEIIGWLYQYYNTELKDDTFAKLKKNVKITKERIPAATQLFTPDWIVRYMVENSVGRIWIEHLRAVDPSTDEKATAERFGWKYYLPEAEQEESVNVKLTEIRTTYKDLKPTDITCIDPCMGSGHILSAMFDVLMDIYESAGYDKREAAFEIVEHNIHGLDIDQRAYQLAYFAVMMKGRGYNRRFLRGRDGKPEPKVYAIVESNEINRNHLQFFGIHLGDAERKIAMDQIEGLLDTFKDAREYGSILNVDECDWELLEKFVEDLDADGQISFESFGSDETQKQLRKLVRVARNLGEKYNAVVTNPPYLSNSRFSPILDKHVKDNYSDVKTDLSMVMFKHALKDLCNTYGYVSFITTTSWMFLSSFEKLRSYVLKEYDFVSLVDFGTELFEGKVGHNPIVAWVNRKSNIGHAMTGVRLVEYCYSRRDEKEKEYFNKKNYHYPKQFNFSKIPGSPVAYWVSQHTFDICNDTPNFESFATTRAGMITGNNNIFIRLWYEVDFKKMGIRLSSRDDAIKSQKKWFPYNKGGDYRKWYGNNDYVVNWENDGVFMRNYKDSSGKIPAHAFNLEYIFKENVTWSSLSSYKFAARYTDFGFLYDASGSFADVKNERILYTLAFLCSEVTQYFLKIMNPTLNFQKGNVSALPFILDEKYIERINDYTEENISISRKDWDSYETSWDFKCHPLRRKVPTISEAFEQWQNECNDCFDQLKSNEEELNRIVIDIYGLQDELTPEVEDKDVTVRKADLVRDIRSFISYAVGCMFGRYSLDEDGLIYAGGELDINRYTTFISDDDNCIPITDEEYFSDDIVARFVEFVKTVYGADTLEENLDFIANALGNGPMSRFSTS